MADCGTPSGGRRSWMVGTDIEDDKWSDACWAADDGTIYQCRKHAAADEMLDVLEMYAANPNAISRARFDEMVRDAIARARGP